MDVCLSVASCPLGHGKLEFEMLVGPFIGNITVSLRIYDYGVQRESRTGYQICCPELGKDT